MEKKKSDLVTKRNMNNPYLQLLGGEILEIEEKSSKVILEEIEPHHLNSSGRVHGGLLYSLADIACGSLMAYYGRKSSTIEGKINYLMSPEKSKSLTFDAELIRHGNKISFLEVKITDQLENLIARGYFTYYSINE